MRSGRTLQIHTVVHRAGILSIAFIAVSKCGTTFWELGLLMNKYSVQLLTSEIEGAENRMLGFAKAVPPTKLKT